MTKLNGHYCYYVQKEIVIQVSKFTACDALQFGTIVALKLQDTHPDLNQRLHVYPN